MLRKENKYMLGTIAEVARELYKTDDEKIFADRFIECDFAVVEKEDFDLENDDLETIHINSTGWYGIKKLDTGFDNDECYSVDLFADYYGGGCGTYKLIGDWLPDEDILMYISKMIIDVLSSQEGTITGDTVIICGLR